MTNLPRFVLIIGGALLIIMGIYEAIADALYGRRDWTAEDSANIVMDVGLIILGLIVFYVGFYFF